MDKKLPRPERFAFDPVTPEEAGAVKGEDGKELKAGDEGFMEALAKEAGFEYVDET